MMMRVDSRTLEINLDGSRLYTKEKSNGRIRGCLFRDELSWEMLSMNMYRSSREKMNIR